MKKKSFPLKKAYQLLEAGPVVMVTTTRNGKANIIIQSDEGAPAPVLNSNLTKTNLNQASDDMTKWSQSNLQAKFGVFASYYIPGASSADLAAGANPINILRLVLNTDFSTSLPYLPECNYAFPEGENQAYVYKNINQELTGQTNLSCPENGNFLNPGKTILVTPSSQITSNKDSD